MTNTKNSGLWQLSLVVVFSVIGYVCNVAATKILTSHISLPLYGDFSVAWSSISLISQIILFGSSISIKRYLSEYHADNSAHKKRSFIRWNFALLLRIFFIIFIVYILFWAIAWITHLQKMHNFENYHLAFSVCIFGVLLSLWTTFNCYILSFGYSTLYAFLNSAAWSGIQLFVICVGFYFFIPSTVSHLSYLIVISLFVLLAVNTLIFSMIPGNELLNSSSMFSPSNSSDTQVKSDYHDPAWFSISRGNMMSSLCFILTSLGPLYILELLSPHEHNVAIYNIGLIVTGFFQLLMPAMYRLYSAKVTTINKLSKEETQKLQSSVSTTVIACTILFVMGLVLFELLGKTIFVFFHIPDIALTDILLLLLCNIFLSNISLLSSTYLQANGDAKFCFFVRLFSLFLVYVVGSVLCIYYDIYGVVATCLTSSLLQYILFTYRSRQRTSFRFSCLF